MNSFYNNGYQETIQKGLSAVRSFRSGISTGAGSRNEQIERLKKEIESADAIVIGAGAGLSTAAGLTYSGERFEKYFGDFAARFGIQDMYSGGFYPFPDEETRWAWWARHIYYNRYIDPPKDVYGKLLALVQDKDYFVITTNVDHQFQRAGFDKKMEAQGFVKDAEGIFQIPQSGVVMKIPAELIPKCMDDGSAVTMNLRADDSFVEDEGWHRASAAYSDFIHRHDNMHTLFFEIGVGANTPVIIKYPFWQMTNDNPKAVYACLNYNEAFCPKQIEKQSICLEGDAGVILDLMLSQKSYGASL